MADTNGNKPKRPNSKMKMSHAIGRFLTDVRAGNGEGRVILGAIPGVPMSTTDPRDVEKAIAHMTKQADAAPGVIKELRLRQRIITLRTELDFLRNGDTTDRDIFIAYGAEWAAQEGITYEAFREIGVPAALLKQAGITRGSV